MNVVRLVVHHDKTVQGSEGLSEVNYPLIGGLRRGLAQKQFPKVVWKGIPSLPTLKDTMNVGEENVAL